MTAESDQIGTKSHQAVYAVPEDGLLPFLRAIGVLLYPHLPVCLQSFLNREHIGKHNDGHQKLATRFGAQVHGLQREAVRLHVLEKGGTEF